MVDIYIYIIAHNYNNSTSLQTGLNVTESFRLLMDRISELRPEKFKDSIAIPKLVQTNSSHNKKCIVS